jgi:hypothetical protein
MSITFSLQLDQVFFLANFAVNVFSFVRSGVQIFSSKPATPKQTAQKISSLVKLEKGLK